MNIQKSLRTYDIIWRPANRRSDKETIDKFERRQRNRSWVSSNTDSEAVRESLGTSSAHVDFSHFEIQRMANAMGRAMGNISFERKMQGSIGACTWRIRSAKLLKQLIAFLLVPQLIHTRAYGRNHVAYLPKRKTRDALAQLVLTWIPMFGKQWTIAIYCSDVSGAFNNN